MQVLRVSVLAVACFVVGAVVLADGRTEIIRLPPVFTVETITDCGGFLAQESFTSEVKVMVQRDKNGDVVKVIQHLSTGGRTTYFNSANPEINFRGGPEQPVLRLDFARGKFTVSGMNYKLTVPGGGMVFHQGGHYYTLDFPTGEWIQVGGPDDLWSGDFDALCQALTP